MVVLLGDVVHVELSRDGVVDKLLLPDPLVDNVRVMEVGQARDRELDALERVLFVNEGDDVDGQQVLQLLYDVGEGGLRDRAESGDLYKVRIWFPYEFFGVVSD